MLLCRVSLLLVLPVLGACSLCRLHDHVQEPCINRHELRADTITVICHGQSNDAFWADGIRPAMLQAASDLNVPLELTLYPPEVASDEIFAQMSQQIQAAATLPAEERPRALVVTVPSDSGVVEATRMATASGIPVVGFNAGSELAASLGMRAFFGQDEYRGTA